MISNIKEAREKTGLSRQAAADRLGIPVRTLKAWESGTRVPPAYVEKMVVDNLLNLVTENKSADKCVQRIHDMYICCKNMFELSVKNDDLFTKFDNEEEKLFCKMLVCFFDEFRRK